MGDITLDERYQLVKNLGRFPADLTLEPSEVQRVYLDNIYKRSLSLLTAHAAGNETILECTTDGLLKVATTGTGYETLGVKAGTAADAFNTTNQLYSADKYHKWNITVESFDAKIRFMDSFGGWLTDYYLLQGVYTIEFVSTTIQIANRNAGSNAIYQIVGMG